MGKMQFVARCTLNVGRYGQQNVAGPANKILEEIKAFC